MFVNNESPNGSNLLIGIGIPNGNNGNNEMMGLIGILAWEIGKLGHKLVYLGRCSACVDLNRNDIMLAAKDIGVDALFMIDTDVDMITTGNIVEHLLSMDKDIVTGVIYQGEYPYRPMIYRFKETCVENHADIPELPFRADAAGAGFLLISKKVIDHFDFDIQGRMPFDYMHSPIFLREDVAFFHRCREAGFELWVEPRLELKHCKRQAIGKEHWGRAKEIILKGKDRIDGFMTEKELEFLYETAATMKTVVEIGSWKGRSTKALLDSGAHVTAVDHWQGSDTIKEIAKNNDIYAEFMGNVGHYPNLSVIRKESLEAAKGLNGDKFDMVFIDASHTYEDCKKDIEAWLPRANKIICGHDYSSAWPGVMRAVSEKFEHVNITDSIWWVELGETVNG